MTSAGTRPAHGTATAARFDVHAHYLLPDAPPAPEAALRSQYFLASPMPSWSPEVALAFMDRNGIGTQMLSMPVPVNAATARAANVYGAELVKAYPTRFGLLACLALTDVDAGLAEIAFAFDELNADGVILLTNYGGAYLGDPKFEVVFAELNRRSAVVFVHPTLPPGFDCVACGRPGPVIEFPFDTCRTVADMLYAGVFERFPDVTFILSHAGGALPALAPRLSSIGTLDWVPHPQGLRPDAVREQLARLYFDTAIAGFEANLAPVLALTSVDHIVFGTDYPPASEPVIEQNIAALDELTLLSEQDRTAVLVGGRRLFSRFHEELAMTAQTDENDLLQLEERRVAAMNAADPEALLALLHDDHIHVMANGMVTDKQGAAESLRSIPRTVEMRTPTVRIYGDVAVMTGPQVNHEQINGQPMTIELFVTRVARRVDGVWKFASMQATRLPS